MSRVAAALGRAWFPLTLAVLAVAFVALAGLWASMLPLFQPYGEVEAFDYAYRIAQTGGIPIERGTPTALEPRVAEAVRFTEVSTVAGHAGTPVAVSYGSLAYFDALRTAARRARRPIHDSDGRPPALGAPPLPYLVLALAIIPFRDDVVSTAFAARGAAIGFVTLTLVVWGFALRRLGVSRPTTLAIVAIVAVLPISSSIAGAVRPEAVTALLVALTTLAAALARETSRARDGVLFGVGLVALCACDLRLAAAAGVAFAWWLGRRRATSAAFAVAAVGGSIVVLMSPHPVPAAPGGGTIAPWYVLLDAFSGLPARSFWTTFGSNDTTLPLFAADGFAPTLTIVMGVAIIAATVAFLRERALGPLVPLLGVALAWSFVAAVRSGDESALGGSAQFPLVVAIVALAVAAMPRVFRLPRLRAAAGIIAGGVLAIYAGAGAIASPAAFSARYYSYDYEAGGRVGKEPSAARILSASPSAALDGGSTAIAVRGGQRLALQGWADDWGVERPCLTAFLTVGRRSVPTEYGVVTFVRPPGSEAPGRHTGDHWTASWTVRPEDAGPVRLTCLTQDGYRLRDVVVGKLVVTP